MRKGFFLFLLLVSVFMISCDGLLWTGQQSASSDSLVLSINNPFGNDTSTSGGRALALQGDFLYIELARIDNSGAYTDPVSPFTTNGNWQETAWGGRAVLTFDLTDLGTIIATFKDVPRDQDLSARIILDPDSATITTGLSGNYGEVPPICHTYNSSGADIFEQLWVTITSTELQQNAVSLPIRPSDGVLFSLTTFNALNSNILDQYVESSAPSYSNSEPNPGNSTYFPTKISSIQIDLNSSSNYLKDVAFYMAVDSNLPLGVAIAELYNIDGTIASGSGGTTTRYFHVAIPTLDSSYAGNLLLGSTNIAGLDFTYTYYSGGSYYVRYGILYDSAMYLNGNDGSVDWSLPAGFISGDLEFQILFIDHTSDLSQDYTQWETISQINGLNPIIVKDWGTCTEIYGLPSHTTSFFYDGTETFNDQPHAVILARVPGGEEFIYARDYFGGA